MLMTCIGKTCEVFNYTINIGLLNYDTSNTWQVATLHVSEPGTLFPFEINAKDHGGVRYVTDFEVHKLTGNKLVLAYPDNGKWDGWSEGTYWCFKTK